MRRARLLALVLLLLPHPSWAQLAGPAIHIYSEFERFDPWGNPVAPDRDLAPREILSPAMPRNGHMSVHIVISGPPGTNYFLYAASNPPDILTLTLYREHFTPCGTGYCPDWLTRQPSPSFGAIPESLFELPGQSTRCYLLDIAAPLDTPPRRVRVEALIKSGTWYVAPMEVRIVAPAIPSVMPPSFPVDRATNLAEISEPASNTAQRQLFRYLTGQPPQLPERLLRVRDFIQRNAAEDMLLARSLETPPGSGFPQLSFLAWSPLTWPELGSEWFLKVRDFLYRL